MAEDKKYKGMINNWWIEEHPADKSIEHNDDGCFVIRGYIYDHPYFDRGVWFRSSQVMSKKADCKEEAVIETLKSKYRLLKRKEEEKE